MDYVEINDGDNIKVREEIAKKFGELIHSEDESAMYEYDEVELYKLDDTYTLIEGTGCSCWDGTWQGYTLLSVEDLLKITKDNKYQRTAEEKMHSWIITNIKGTK